MLNAGRLTVLTVSWNSGGRLLQWSREWGELGCRLLVADNGSTDGAPARCGARVVQTGGNRGFGAGINAAAAAADTELVLVTNPDTLPGPRGSLDALLLGYEPGSLSGAQLVDARGDPVPSGGIWPTVRWVAGQVAGRASTLWRPGRVDWVQGALMLAERELFLDTLGGFSDEFPLYFEDTDICARAASIGVPRRFTDAARFLHAEGTGAPGSRAARLAGFHWGLWRWFVRHRPGRAGTVRALLVLKCAGRAAAGGRDTREGYRASLSAILGGTMPALPVAAGREGAGESPCVE